MSMLSRFATLGGVPPDPYFASVALLLVGNGANGTTTNIRDSSNNNLTASIFGNTVISTAQSKFGSGSSVFFDGAGDYVTFPAGASMNISSGNFTIEAWVYYTSPQQSTSSTIFHLSRGGGAGFHLHRNTSGYLVIDNGEAATTPGTIFIPLNTWVHIAAVRISNQIYGYVNGAQCINTATQAYIAPNVALVGRYSGSAEEFKGYMYDARITKGVARYTGNYTPSPFPPTAPMPTYGP